MNYALQQCWKTKDTVTWLFRLFIVKIVEYETTNILSWVSWDAWKQMLSKSDKFRWRTMKKCYYKSAVDRKNGRRWQIWQEPSNRTIIWEIRIYICKIQHLMTEMNAQNGQSRSMGIVFYNLVISWLTYNSNYDDRSFISIHESFAKIQSGVRFGVLADEFVEAVYKNHLMNQKSFYNFLS